MDSVNRARRGNPVSEENRQAAGLPHALELRAQPQRSLPPTPEELGEGPGLEDRGDMGGREAAIRASGCYNNFPCGSPSPKGSAWITKSH
jgi:hypothetical protein